MKTECDQPTFLLGVALDLEQCMRLAADFWISIFNDSTPEDHNENLLMSGLAVVSIKDDHTLAGPIESLPKLEALINVGKALVVRKAKSERDQQVEGWVEVGESRESAERGVRGVFERVKRRMDPSMKSVAHGGEENVLSKLNELREYAQEVKEGQRG